MEEKNVILFKIKIERKHAIARKEKKNDNLEPKHLVSTKNSEEDRVFHNTNTGLLRCCQ